MGILMKNLTNRIKDVLRNFVVGKNLKKQLPLMLTGVFMMGVTVSVLNLVDMGTDTYTNMNLAISARVGLTFGTWQLILNIVLLILVLILGADNFGFGTIANMVLIGYLCDFFTWIWKKILPAALMDKITADINLAWLSNKPNNWISILAVKMSVMLVALALFVFFAALYMDSGLGVSPCDAISFIAKKKLPKVPIKLIRIIYDILLIFIALAFGSKLYPVTIIMAFTLGPVIEFVGNHIKKWFS